MKMERKMAWCIKIIRNAMFKAETNRWKLVIKVTKPLENSMARINPNDLFMHFSSWQTSAWCSFHAIKPTTPFYSFKPISTIFSNRSFNTSKRTLDAETKTKNHDRIVQLKVLAVLKEKSTKKIKIIAAAFASANVGDIPKLPTITWKRKMDYT